MHVLPLQLDEKQSCILKRHLDGIIQKDLGDTESIPRRLSLKDTLKQRCGAWRRLVLGVAKFADSLENSA